MLHLGVEMETNQWKSGMPFHQFNGFPCSIVQNRRNEILSRTSGHIKYRMKSYNQYFVESVEISKIKFESNSVQHARTLRGKRIFLCKGSRSFFFKFQKVLTLAAQSCIQPKDRVQLFFGIYRTKMSQVAYIRYPAFIKYNLVMLLLSKHHATSYIYVLHFGGALVIFFRSR